MASSPDTEITLGTGKLLVLFFGLVAVCAAFFAVGHLFFLTPCMLKGGRIDIGTCTGRKLLGCSLTVPAGIVGSTRW